MNNTRLERQVDTSFDELRSWIDDLKQEITNLELALDRKDAEIETLEERLEKLS